jgi:RNA polymerase sigma factor (sigma-70 family)
MKPDGLLRRAMAGDKAAESELIRAFNARLFFYFRARIKGERHYEDLVQEVFAAFFDGLRAGKVEREEMMAPFLFGIAKRVQFNYFYRKKRGDELQRRVELAGEFTTLCREQERLENERLVAVLRQAIGRLPRTDQIILHEFYLRENGVGEIAAQLGRSKHYVSVRKERALKKLRLEISGD